VHPSSSGVEEGDEERGRIGKWRNPELIKEREGKNRHGSESLEERHGRHVPEQRERAFYYSRMFGKQLCTQDS